MGFHRLLEEFQGLIKNTYFQIMAGGNRLNLEFSNTATPSICFLTKIFDVIVNYENCLCRFCKTNHDRNGIGPTKVSI